MFDKRGFEGEILEKGQSAVRSTAKGAKKQVTDFGKAATGQLGGSGSDPGSANHNTDQGTNEAGSSPQQPQMTDEERVEFLRNLYGKSDNNSKKSQGSAQSQKQQKNPVSNALGLPQNDPNKNKTPEEIAKLEALRNKLHKEEYYDPTFNAPKQQEEGAQEKVEREDEEGKMAELETKREKPPELPVTVKQGTGERLPGVSG